MMETERLGEGEGRRVDGRGEERRGGEGGGSAERTS
jgi:hypothetical protein